MKAMGLGEKYLGIPLQMHRSRTQNCKPIVDHMNTRLQGWSSKIINQACKTTHLNSVLSTMSSYHMQVLRIPDSTIQEMNRIQRNYWWNNSFGHNSRHFINWNNMKLPKRFGGL